MQWENSLTLKERIDDTIHIRPSLDDVEEAMYHTTEHPEHHSHIVMVSANNFLVIMHHPDHKCFVCIQTGQVSKEEKYVY